MLKSALFDVVLLSFHMNHEKFVNNMTTVPFSVAISGAPGIAGGTRGVPPIGLDRETFYCVAC